MIRSKFCINIKVLSSTAFLPKVSKAQNKFLVTSYPTIKQNNTKFRLNVFENLFQGVYQWS